MGCRTKIYGDGKCGRVEKIMEWIIKKRCHKKIINSRYTINRDGDEVKYGESPII